MGKIYKCFLLSVLFVAVGCGTEPTPTPATLIISLNPSDRARIQNMPTNEVEQSKNASINEAETTSTEFESNRIDIQTTREDGCQISNENLNDVQMDSTLSKQTGEGETSTAQINEDEVNNTDTTKSISNSPVPELDTQGEKYEPTSQKSPPVKNGSLFLALESPTTLELIVKEPYLLIEGMTRLDALLTVGADVVEPDINGHFKHKMQLNDDHNLIEILASTSSGETQSLIIAAIYSPER